MPKLVPAPYRAWALTRPTPMVWRLTLDDGGENRLAPEVLTELSAHLDTVEAEWRTENEDKDDRDKKGGALIITSGNPKFFSNGLLPHTLKSPDFMLNIFEATNYRILTFPLITIAAVNGHCFAGGMLLALSCDYRVVTSGKGMWCMSEVVIGVPVGGSNGALLRAKMPPQAVRDALTGKRFFQPDLLKWGIADEVVKPEELIPRSIKLGESEGVRVALGTYGVIKDGVYSNIFDSSNARRALPYQDTDRITFWDRVLRQRAKL